MSEKTVVYCQRIERTEAGATTEYLVLLPTLGDAIGWREEASKRSSHRMLGDPVPIEVNKADYERVCNGEESSLSFEELDRLHTAASAGSSNLQEARDRDERSRRERAELD